VETAAFQDPGGKAGWDRSAVPADSEKALTTPIRIDNESQSHFQMSHRGGHSHESPTIPEVCGSVEQVVNETLTDIRTPIAVSPSARVELGRDGTLHVLVGPVTLHVERHLCEELATTLAVAMVRLYEHDDQRRSNETPSSPVLRLVASEPSECSG